MKIDLNIRSSLDSALTDKSLRSEASGLSYSEGKRRGYVSRTQGILKDKGCKEELENELFIIENQKLQFNILLNKLNQILNLKYYKVTHYN